jgi:hypothetical protein
MIGCRRRGRSQALNIGPAASVQTFRSVVKRPGMPADRCAMRPDGRCLPSPDPRSKVHNHASSSLRPACLSVIAALTFALGVAPATASASQAGRATHAAQKQQRIQAREQRRNERATLRQERKAQKLQHKSARQAERTTREAEREARRATRAAERSQRTNASGDPSVTPPAPAPEGKPEASTNGAEGQSAPARGDCAVSAEASEQQVVAGETVTISGKLTCATGDAGEQELTVTQHQTAAGAPSSDLPVTTTTASDGSYQLQSAPINGRTVFLVRSTGARHAARVIVLATGSVSLQGPAANEAALPMGAGRAAGGPARASFSGVLLPMEAGRQVALKVRYGGGEWRTVAFARTDADGAFSFTHRFRYAGEVDVMAVARPRGTQRAQSPALNYTIVQAQNPALTIQSSTTPPAPTEGSATPLAAGQPTTISGVASGAPHQTVTLLARGASGHFAPVASAQTDDAGAYTFTVDPSETTVYEVASGRSRSTALRVEVG